MSTFKKMNADLLEIRVFDTRKALGEDAACEVARKIRELLAEKPQVNMIFASAPSQNEFLEALAKENIDWTRINAFHMDEYIGLDKDALQGFGNFIRDRLFCKVNCGHVYYLDGNASDIQAECERYSHLLKKYPVDIVCLGIGENGHLAFNDPPVADFNDPKLIKVVQLEQKCRQQQVNDGCFTSLDKVPETALSLTIPALMAGRFIYGMVPGKTKTEAVFNTVRSTIGTHCPATILRKHEHTILFTDMDSANRIL